MDSDPSISSFQHDFFNGFSQKSLKDYLNLEGQPGLNISDSMNQLADGRSSHVSRKGENYPPFGIPFEIRAAAVSNVGVDFEIVKLKGILDVDKIAKAHTSFQSLADNEIQAVTTFEDLTEKNPPSLRYKNVFGAFLPWNSALCEEVSYFENLPVNHVIRVPQEKEEWGKILEQAGYSEDKNRGAFVKWYDLKYSNRTRKPVAFVKRGYFEIGK